MNRKILTSIPLSPKALKTLTSLTAILILLILVLPLSGCLNTSSTMRSTSIDAKIISVRDVTNQYPIMQKAAIGWYTSPTLDGRASYDASAHDTTKTYYFVWNKPAQIYLNSQDSSTEFSLSHQPISINTAPGKRITRIVILVDTPKSGLFEIIGYGVPPFTIEIP